MYFLHLFNQDKGARAITLAYNWFPFQCSKIKKYEDPFFFSVLFMPYNKSFIDQASSVKMAGYWPSSLFNLRFYGPRRINNIYVPHKWIALFWRWSWENGGRFSITEVAKVRPSNDGARGLLPRKKVLKCHPLSFRIFRTGYCPGFKIKVWKIYFYLKLSIF